MFRPTPITPSSPSPPSLDRRNSNPCRAPASPMPVSATSLLSRMVSLAMRQSPPPVSIIRPDSPAPTTSSYTDDKIEWETLSRRGSDPSQCGYFSFPDFDRLTSISGCSSRHDESSSA